MSCDDGRVDGMIKFPLTAQFLLLVTSFEILVFVSVPSSFLVNLNFLTLCRTFKTSFNVIPCIVDEDWLLISRYTGMVSPGTNPHFGILVSTVILSFDKPNHRSLEFSWFRGSWMGNRWCLCI